MEITNNEKIENPILTNFSSDLKDSIKKIYVYVIFFTIIYALYIGFKMVELLSAGKTIPPLMKSGHVHILGVAFLLLFLIYDLKAKLKENLKIPWALGEITIGIALLGHIIAGIGYSLAGIYNNMKLGLLLVHIGDIALMYLLISYILIAIIAELYK
jgi:hypothetical protein